MPFGTTYSPTVPGGGAEVTNCDQCLHIVMIIGKCTDSFGEIFLVGRGVEGREGSYAGGNFHGGICYGGREFL